METFKNDEKNLKKGLDKFIDDTNQDECKEGEECYIKQPQDVIERVEKKFITKDGRQLLI